MPSINRAKDELRYTMQTLNEDQAMVTFIFSVFPPFFLLLPSLFSFFLILLCFPSFVFFLGFLSLVFFSFFRIWCHSKSLQAALRSSSLSSSSSLFSSRESCSWSVTIQSFRLIISSANKRSFGNGGGGRRVWLSASNRYNSFKSAKVKWRSICCSSTTRQDKDSFVT